MNTKSIFAAFTLGSLILASSANSKADEASAIAAVESYEGQVLGIAKDVEGVRILIPAKTFEGRILADADLAVLKEIPKVIELDLKNASIGDPGAAHLSALKDLQRLHLEKTKITDTGLAHLKDLTGLVYLNLYGTEVTDAGLDHLKGLTSLKHLYLWQTKVSEEAAKSFQTAMETAGNDALEINLGWEKELLSKARLTALKAQRAALEASEVETTTEVTLVEDPDFKTHILPIFQERCVDCHGIDKQKAKLRLDTYEKVMEGGRGDASIVAGDLIGSYLFQVISLPADDDDLMPPKGDPLTETQVGLIRNWILKGAKPEATLSITQKSETSDEISPNDRVAELEAENEELRKKLKQLLEKK